MIDCAWPYASSVLSYRPSLLIHKNLILFSLNNCLLPARFDFDNGVPILHSKEPTIYYGTFLNQYVPTLLLPMLPSLLRIVVNNPALYIISRVFWCGWGDSNPQSLRRRIFLLLHVTMAAIAL